MRNIRLNCDLCGWTFDVNRVDTEQIKTWHHVSCPACNKGEIISDYDIIMFRVMSFAEKLSKVIAFLTFGLAKTTNVEISTAGGKLSIKEIGKC